jgi:hypothetical protein
MDNTFLVLRGWKAYKVIFTDGDEGHFVQNRSNDISFNKIGRTSSLNVDTYPKLDDYKVFSIGFDEVPERIMEQVWNYENKF